jgi:hypothetical protein
MQIFDELGQLVEQCWKDQNYDEKVFPQICEQALLEANLIDRVEPLQIIRQLLSSVSWPSREDDAFSDLPLVLYAGPRFFIDIYFWLDGTTAIHQHGFAGAFQVLSGSSIHSTYSFTREREINPHFCTGQIVLEDVQVLEQGNIRRIIPGEQFIHSLFHLDRPSTTITVRTKRSPGNLPQYSYLKPYLAHDPFFKEPLSLKKIDSINMLLRLNHPEAYSLISELISSSDVQTTFLILTAVFENLVNRARENNFSGQNGQETDEVDEWENFHELFRKAHNKHGAVVNLMAPVLGEMQRQASVVDLRRCVRGSEHRFFLALLLNVPHRTRILDLVRQRFPQSNPIDHVCRWITEFSNTKNALSRKSNILGIDDFSDAHLFVLRQLLEGASAEEIKDSFGKENSLPLVPNGNDVEALCRSLRSSVLIDSLLR